MKKMIRFEIKKLIDRKVLIVFLVLFIFNAIHIISLHINDVSSQFYQGKRKIVETVEGSITQEKVNFLFDGLKKNTQLVDAGEYDSENGDENTYTGYIFGDMNAFEEVYTDLKRVYEYSYNIDTKLSIIDENIERGHQSHSYSSFLKNQLDGRTISSYYDTQGIQEYLNYSDSIIFIFIFILFGGVNYLYYDRNHDMEKMLNITKYGRFKLKLLRFMILNIFVIVSSLAFLISDYICFSLLYNINGVFNPIYSLPNFHSTYFDISIFSHMALQILLKLLGISCISCLMLLLSKRIKTSYIVLVLCFVISLFMWSNLYTINSSFSILNLSQIFSVHNILSFYIHDIFLIAIGLVFLLIVMSLCYFRKGMVKE